MNAPTWLWYLFPRYFAEVGPRWRERSLQRWSDEAYNWDKDEWDGLKNTITPPDQTWENGHGDCDDYALVAVSWALSNDHDDVEIAVCWEPRNLLPAHVIAADSEHVYSSGQITDETVDEYIHRSRYKRCWRRRV